MTRHKPESGGVRFSLYIDNRVNDKIMAMAKGENSSRNAIVNDILETWFFQKQDTPVTVAQKLDHITHILEGYDFS